jgi:Ca2+-binding RTX toxin-like protein
MATLTITGNHDYTNDVLVNITDITFNTTLTTFAAFDSAQFDNVQISTSVHITADANINFITVQMSNPGTFSAAGWTFTNWMTGVDAVFIPGSAGADTITGSSGDNFITGGGGADTLTGGSTFDTFNYNAGTDIEAGESINGLGGTDSIAVGSNETGPSYDFSVATLAGIERLFMNSGPAGSATVTLAGDQIGLGGIIQIIDSALLANALIITGSLVDLSPVLFTNWTSGVDTLTINGTVGLDNLVGSNQADTINGGGNADSMAGGAGSDTYFVDHAGDLVDESPVGSDGTDLVISSVDFNLGDIIHAKGQIENLTLTGSAINGTGNSLDNILIGNANANSLDGRASDDSLTGGLGKDTLSGGIGADTFDFNLKTESKNGALRDVITDFTNGVDDIDVSGIDAKSGVNGNQTFHWIGKQAFHHHKGELNYHKVNKPGLAHDKTIVSGDINGDGKADFQIQLTGLHNLHQDDFVL